MNPIFARPHNRKRNRFKAMLKANWADFKTKLTQGVVDLAIALCATVLMVLFTMGVVVAPLWTIIAVVVIGCAIGAAKNE